MQPPDELAAVGPVRDPQQHVPADVRRGTLEERAGLDVVELKIGMGRLGHGCAEPSVASGAREARAGAGWAVPGRGTCRRPAAWRNRLRPLWRGRFSRWRGG